MSEKLIVVSVVDGRPPLGIYGRISAWSAGTLAGHLRTERYRQPDDFFPVAAFVADVDLFKDLYRLPALPATVWLGDLARDFHRAVISPDYQTAVFQHYRCLRDGGATLLAAWELAVGLGDLTS